MVAIVGRERIYQVTVVLFRPVTLRISSFLYTFGRFVPSLLEMDPSQEKKLHHDAQSDIEAPAATTGGVFDANDNEEFEVFKTTAGVNFRTVEWPRATVIFLKVIFAVGVLTIPTAMYDLGAVGGKRSDPYSMS